jgi:hypothetical protein
LSRLAAFDVAVCAPPPSATPLEHVAVIVTVVPLVGESAAVEFETRVLPDGPVGPVAPVLPVGPVAPVLPVGPAGPVGPVEPVEPVLPVEPVTPVAPV